MSAMTCPSCGRETKVDPAWKYCDKCGARLAIAGTSSAEALAPVGRPNPAAAKPERDYRTYSSAASPPAANFVQVQAAPARPRSKAYILGVALAFSFAGAVVGGILGWLLHIKGGDMATAGIAAGGGAAFTYLKRQGAFPEKKSSH